ncbi:hypothetical protein ES703_86407 [subsurface metagenome]
MKKSSQPQYNIGDAIRGEKISVRARAIDKARIIEGSGRDKIQATTLRGSAYCVIDLPVKWVLEKKS